MDWEENRERKPYQNVLCGGKICFQLKIKVQITGQSSEIQIHRTFTWIFFYLLHEIPPLFVSGNFYLKAVA